MKNIISIDLGTTNIKVCVYDHTLHEIAVFSENVSYNTNGDFVEFDPENYFSSIYSLIVKAGRAGMNENGASIAQIVLTGQAESLILLGSGNRPVFPGISWMDMRSRKECEELTEKFPVSVSYPVTGQPELIPTWPITKILWTRKNRPEVFQKVETFLLLKDYIILSLCGKALGDQSIYGFSHYFNITEKTYWKEILDYCGVSLSQLPESAPSGAIAGNLLQELRDPSAGLTGETKINIGTLDHFAGMIGTGNIRPGTVSESAGTVLSLAALTDGPVFGEEHLPLYCGPFPDSYVVLPVCESGGFCLEWYRSKFLPETSFTEISEEVGKRAGSRSPIFLPYLIGTNAPDFNESAAGVFFGVRSYHDSYDFAKAVMEGVGFLLKINLESLEKAGIHADRLISTGGGAKSAVWTGIKANITGITIEVPENTEAPCLGAAMMGAVSEGYYPSYEEAAVKCVRTDKHYLPDESNEYEKKFAIFRHLYESLGDVYKESAGVIY